MAKESKHVIQFRNKNLNDNESIVAFGDGYIGEAMGTGDKTQHNGSLIVTNERVAFYRKGIFGEIIETMPIANITSIERKSFMGHRTITLHTSHDSLSFKTYEKETEMLLVQAIESGRNKTNIEQKPSIQQPSNPLEKLKQLSEMKDSGLITEDEFSIKKAEILKQL